MSARYRIRVQGHLSEAARAWFPGLAAESEPDGATALTGLMRDQAELHGALTRVRDLNLTLLSVARLEPESAGAAKD